MNRYIPGRLASLEEYRPDTTPRPVRLDANESPYGLDPLFAEKAAKLAASLTANRYPDPYASELIGAFAKAYGCQPEQVVAGNGSDELISLLNTVFVRPGERVLVTDPDFSMYDFYAALVGAEPIHAEKSPEGEVRFDELLRLVKEKKPTLVFLSNPCNPTGRAVSRETILSFVKQADCLVVIDEAYAEFNGRTTSVLDKVGAFENLIVLKTLSKAFGMAALRVGFAVSNTEIASVLRKTKSPYNVNTFSQIMGAEALSRYAMIFDRAVQIGKAAKELGKRLAVLLDGKAEVYEPDANFVLMKPCDAVWAKRVYEALKEKGITIRCMSGGRFLRITCGSDAENEALLNALTAILKEEG